MGAMVRRSAGRRVVALISGLLIVGSCLAITAAAVASPGDSCHTLPYAANRCDASLDAFGLASLAPPAGAFQLPELRPLGRVHWRPLPTAHEDLAYWSITPRAPPRS